MTRRKSIARRTPVVVYRVEADADEPLRVNLRAWEADDIGRMIQSRPFGRAWTDLEPDQSLTGGGWILSTDTDAIHELPDVVRDQLWDFDDAIRAALM